MAQYIQNPSLMGMQQANEQQRQRSQIYAQAVASAADQMYRQSLADQALERQTLYERELMKMKINPRTGQPQEFATPEVYGQQLMDVANRSRANAMGINLAARPGEEARYIGTNIYPTPGAQPLNAASYPGMTQQQAYLDQFRELQRLTGQLPPLPQEAVQPGKVQGKVPPLLAKPAGQP